ncbi:hypothetical protein P7B02_15320 [Caulobacter segnis]|uniref:hypothetical protein n=1 Tax=Caulobacter segnis TaxID=88688 RepID=UPI00240EC240|nr:hypothetical protein [Caulobacter segnis]MDG2522904.1 hypothetical protein [Caulobacter segnis]
MTLTDMWRENIRNGVEALGFQVLRLQGKPPQLIAEAGQQRLAPSVLRSAFAAIELDKLVGADPHLAALERPRAALLDAIEIDPAIAQMAAYQAALAEALWRKVASDPETIIAEMAAPHF